MLLIFSTPVLIRHLWQLKTIVFLHWCLICAPLFLKVQVTNFIFQEFGQGARARRLYENDSEDEEEKEVVILKENPKLQQGSSKFIILFLNDNACSHVV